MADRMSNAPFYERFCARKTRGVECRDDSRAEKRQTYNELIPLQKNKANIDSNRGLNMIDSLETATV